MKHTGDKWSQILGISVENPTGWSCPKAYKSQLITRDEFLNRCSNSVIVPPENLSRSAASKLRRELYKK